MPPGGSAFTGQPGPIPTGPFPPGFKPIVFPDRSNLDGRGWSRPYRSKEPVKAVRFISDDDRELARLIELKAQLEKVRINEVLLRLLRQGLHAEAGTRKS